MKYQNFICYIRYFNKVITKIILLNNFKFKYNYLKFEFIHEILAYH